MSSSSDQFLYSALIRLKDNLPRLAHTLALTPKVDLPAWQNVLANKLLNRLHPDLPLVAAICGAGSSGKSSLFNALARESISPTGGRAGMNRRVLIAAREPQGQTDSDAAQVAIPWLPGTSVRLLGDPRDLLTPGDPLLARALGLSQGLVLLDTPDFDTGARGDYANRTTARQALEAADILIYIFTNANYNNRDNTDFMVRMLTDIGVRRCFLVYRVYPAYDDDQVREHALTVGRHIYGEKADGFVLGIFRADEDNAVAAGERFIATRQIAPVASPAGTQGGADLSQALTRLDARAIRLDLTASLLTDVLGIGADLCRLGRISLDELRLYQDVLEGLQSACVKDALRHFPLDQVLERFAAIWLETDPTHIKALRRAGTVLEFPFKALWNTLKWTGRRFGASKSETASTNAADPVKSDLQKAATHLFLLLQNDQAAISLPAADPAAERIKATAERLAALGQQPEITLEKDAVLCRIGAHPALTAARQDLREMAWESRLEAILAQSDEVSALSESMETELFQLTRDLRAGMSQAARVRQTFNAVLSVLPAALAATYVLGTGDPVGATGIKVKLTGLFGLNDLYALVAIPAASGLKKAERKHLERLVSPVIQIWLDSKLQIVKSLFEAQISGRFFAAMQLAIRQSEGLLETLEADIGICQEVLQDHPLPLAAAGGFKDLAPSVRGGAA